MSTRIPTNWPCVCVCVPQCEARFTAIAAPLNNVAPSTRQACPLTVNVRTDYWSGVNRESRGRRSPTVCRADDGDTLLLDIGAKEAIVYRLRLRWRHIGSAVSTKSCIRTPFLDERTGPGARSSARRRSLARRAVSWLTRGECTNCVACSDVATPAFWPTSIRSKSREKFSESYLFPAGERRRRQMWQVSRSFSSWADEGSTSPSEDFSSPRRCSVDCVFHADVIPSTELYLVTAVRHEATLTDGLWTEATRDEYKGRSLQFPSIWNDESPVH